MNNAKYAKECPICGKHFVPCSTDLGMFNWRRVACSPECGKEYFRRVLIARGENIPDEIKVTEPEKPKTRKKKSVKAE